MNSDEILGAPVFGLSQDEKAARLTRVLAELNRHHQQSCTKYARILDVLWPQWQHSTAIAEMPWLPVSLFKTHRLLSVDDSEVKTVLISSGTTGQLPSRIHLDAPTADRQARALTRIMSQILGPRRLPMIIVDSKALLKDRRTFTARAAGVLGMLNFGARPFFALNEDMSLDVEGLRQFLHQHGQADFVIFGFTYMVWQYLYENIRGLGFDLRRGLLVHSGGWKKLADRAIDNTSFKKAFADATGLTRVYSFYGMVEQVGSVFLEGADGLLYPPAFADVIIRDPVTFAEVPRGVEGVIQVVSVLPTSYPGHSLLTEDLGVVECVDQGADGRKGKGFRVLGRIPHAELRGCSDTHTERQ